MRKTRLFQAAVAVAATLGGALAAAPALGDAQTPSASKAVVKKVIVNDNFFEPRYLEIHKGDRVVWVWKGDNSHNITFTKVPKLASKKGAEARRTGRWSRKFQRRGLYKYVCTIHSGQRGSIEVLRAEPPNTSAQ
jgi:plastocyanin